MASWRSPLATCLLLALHATAQQQPEGRVAVSVAASPARPVVGQQVRVAVRVEVLDAFLRDQVIQPFRQPLDVPIQVLAPWWSGDGRLRPLEGDAGDGVRIAVDGQAVRAQALGVSERGGQRYSAFVVERLFRAEAVGPVELGPTSVKLAYATRWRDDFLAGRVPEDRSDLEVAAASAAVDVRPIPDRDRPADYTGAVGRFTVEAAVEPRAVDVGGTVRWTWTVRGAGNLDAFAPPAAPALDGFHVLGRLEERRPDARAFVFELSALRPGKQELPPVEFGYFDPDLGDEGAFALARAEAFAVEVTGEMGPEDEAVVAPVTGDVPPPGERTTQPARPGALRVDGREPGASLAPGAVRALMLGALLVGIAVRVGIAAAAALRRRRARLLVAFESGLRAGGDPRDLLVDMLARGLGCAPAAVLRPDIAEQLVAGAGVPARLAARVAEVLEACTAFRHGGPAALPDVATLRALGAELAPALEARGGSR